MWTSLTSKLRAYLLAGILVTAPILITLYVVVGFVSFVDSHVTPLLPLRAYVPGLGLVIALLFFTLVGALTAGYGGRLVVGLSETILARMPVVRGIYGAVKQIIDTLFGQKSTAFRKVAMVEYPRSGVWTIGFITGETKGEVRRRAGCDLVNVLVLTTPNPTSGFLLFVPREEIQVLDMGVEEAMKMLISGGLVTPPDREELGGVV